MLETKEWKDEIDRTGWESGPWDNESDKKQWEDKETGLPCLIVRNAHGNLCGYVGVDKSHPFFGKDYIDDDIIDLEVHGGLTHSGECDGRICHEVKTNFLGIGVVHLEDDKIWWLGFDTAHFGDMTPYFTRPEYSDTLRLLTNGAYRNISYVTEECTNLAKQIKNYAQNQKSN